MRTDHREAIARLRATYWPTLGGVRKPSLEAMYDEAAASLLEVHDATGISLDVWEPVLAFVEDRLALNGVWESVTPNHV